MIKLYRYEAGKPVAYHEAWVSGSEIVEHWGKLGERGETREHRVNKQFSEEQNLQQVLAGAYDAGYESIDIDHHSVLFIEYLVEGVGTVEDLEKRYALEERMDQTLGWTGLGLCDGGSIGSGTMEVCCFVIDFEIAKRVIQEDLESTEFEDYSRIYTEEPD